MDNIFDENNVKEVLYNLFEGKETYLTRSKISKEYLDNIAENERIFMENIKKQIKQE